MSTLGTLDANLHQYDVLIADRDQLDHQIKWDKWQSKYTIRRINKMMNELVLRMGWDRGEEIDYDHRPAYGGYPDDSLPARKHVSWGQAVHANTEGKGLIERIWYAIWTWSWVDLVIRVYSREEHMTLWDPGVSH